MVYELNADAGLAQQSVGACFPSTRTEHLKQIVYHAAAHKNSPHVLSFVAALKEGDIALFDMGAEYQFYGSDITCSFPVIYAHCNQNYLIQSKPSIEKEGSFMNLLRAKIFMLAEKIILESLETFGIIVGDIDEMVAERLGAIFLPHGLGHLLGIDTHDPGGYTKGMERPKEPGLSSLRTIRELKEGMKASSARQSICIKRANTKGLRQIRLPMSRYRRLVKCPKFFLARAL
ncbi:Xaa-Pro dipeptidase [Dendrobium catenatum]|uniref:Xaa-Pro dipeptidase n=1 Tax=Dendrobium catenatum TaxID=906689 RepID=A0A2I0VJ02_9ASPA|nr:Xaa-Pro dipeptidase [Dendrobium catenatum]